MVHLIVIDALSIGPWGQAELYHLLSLLALHLLLLVVPQGSVLFQHLPLSECMSPLLAVLVAEKVYWPLAELLAGGVHWPLAELPAEEVEG